MAATISLNKAMSSSTPSSRYHNGLPPQTATIDEKETDEWKRGCMNFMVNEARQQDKAKARDMKKYMMLDDEYVYKDKWALDPLNLGDKKDELYGGTDPIQHYPIINTPLNTILGERINRTTQFFCVSNAPESRNEYYRQKGEMLLEQVTATIQQTVLQSILKKAQQSGQQIDEAFMKQAQEQVPQMMPDSIQRYMDTDYADTIEQVHNRILKNLIRRNDIESEFIEGFRHSTIVGKEAYMFEVVNNNLKVKYLPSPSVFYHKSKINKWISEGQYAGYRLFLTPSSIIDTYREHLGLEDIDRLENKMNPSGRGGGVNSLTGIKSIAYDTSTFYDWQGNTFDNLNRGAVDNMLDDFMQSGNSTYDRSRFGLFEVTQAYWKSYRKVGILEVFIENDTPIEQLVDENYEPDENAGEYVKWFYLNQVYQGTDIAGEFLVNVGPYPYQIFDERDPDYSPLPIEGCEYNNFNGKTIAIADLMLPWAEFYDIVANELKKDLKKALGKVMFMSVDHIPDIPGFDMNKWMYWAKEFGIAWVGAGKNKSSFSHFSAQDMSFAEQIVSKMNLLDKIKMNCDAFGGFSQPRVAGASSAPTQSQDEQKLTASVNQTEYYFWKHGKCCEKVLTHALNISKYLLTRKRDYTMLYDDLDQRYIEADLDKAIAANCAIYVINSSQIVNKRQALQQMAMSAAGKTGQPADMADIIMGDTVNEIKRSLKSIQRKSEQAQQQAQQMEQQKIQAEQQAAAEELAWKKEEHYTSLESKERQVYMQTFARQQDNLKDNNANGEPDILEQEQHFEEVNNNMRKHQNDLRKMDMEERMKSKELDIKSKELNVKRDKNSVDRENQQNDLEIAKINAKNRNRP